jgi:hypothetical protein
MVAFFGAAKKATIWDIFDPHKTALFCTLPKAKTPELRCNSEVFSFLLLLKVVPPGIERFR